jgi:hypothetical protein
VDEATAEMDEKEKEHQAARDWAISELQQLNSNAVTCRSNADDPAGCDRQLAQIEASKGTKRAREESKEIMADLMPQYVQVCQDVRETLEGSFLQHCLEGSHCSCADDDVSEAINKQMPLLVEQDCQVDVVGSDDIILGETTE